jgi:threonyl-tRNA synthetase
MSEISVRLPDGKLLAVPAGTTVLAVAERIGPGLARAAVAGRIDGRLVDLRAPLDRDVALEIVTARDPQAGTVIRHSAEHVMADAVKRLFPTAQIDVGRSDHAEKFQYDFLVERPFSPQDLERIEEEMRRILAEGAVFEREEVDRAQAKARFAELGEHLKVSRIDDIPAGDPITIYRHGAFQDLCRGPHVQRAGQIGAVKLIELAGAYWRGDERNPMLQRIYGVAFASAKELEEYLERLEQARRRDHRRLGQELDLFHLDPLSPGSPFFHPNGVVLFNELVGYVRSLYPKYGFQEIITPQIFRSDLFKTSGHYENFGDDMFRFQGDEDEELFVKPMNCPGHCVYYNTTKHSYRDLPLRFAEFTRLHRNERSGTLHGLSRVRSFAQDDAHVFCMPEQVESELRSFFAMLSEIYQALGLDDVQVSVSTRPEKFIGTPEAWDHAEKLLVAAVEEAGYRCGIKAGEAVFYAPKVECDFRDVMGRVWTLGTIQVDMSAPDRFGLSYVGSDGQEHRAAMLHRAVLGSLERFIAVYLEHTGGDFPLWLSPVQVAVLPIAERHIEWGARVRDALGAHGLRVRLDDRNEKLNFKIREAETHKIPVMAVVGDQEVTSGTVTPRRRRGGQGAAAALPLDAFVAELSAKVAERRP